MLARQHATGGAANTLAAAAAAADIDVEGEGWGDDDLGKLFLHNFIFIRVVVSVFSSESLFFHN